MKVDYEWNGSPYPTRNDMLDAIVEAWATAWGRNSLAETLQAFEKKTDDELAAEAIANWALYSDTESCGEGDTHMPRVVYTETELVAAFKRVRARLGEAAPEA